MEIIGGFQKDWSKKSMKHSNRSSTNWANLYFQDSRNRLYNKLKKNKMSFLKAEWRKLIMVNYAIEPEILKPFVPFGTELDYWNGKCYVSIVGFMFLNTRVLGLKIPFHTNFEEVNLRFYVKRKEGENWKRGVVFVKEIVPKHAITFIANTFYKENYITLQMSHKWKTLGGQLSIEYSWRTKNMVNSLSVVAKRDSEQILENSEAEFITEHYWGYAKNNKAKTN